MKNNQEKDKNSSMPTNSSINGESGAEYRRDFQKNKMDSEEFATPKFSQDDFENPKHMNSEYENLELNTDNQNSRDYTDFVEGSSKEQNTARTPRAERNTNPENYQSEKAENNDNDASLPEKESLDNKSSKHNKQGNKKSSLKDKITNANIKQIFFFIMGAIVIFLAVWGLLDIINSIKAAKNPMLTPETATRHLVSSISAGDYEEFKKLAEPMKNIDNEKALYDKLKKSLETSKDNLITNFVMIKLENGEQYLCSLYHDENKDEYVFRSIVEIPAASQGFFAR